MNRKVTVVGGAGNVGATVARSIAEKELADVVIVDIADQKAAGVALDILRNLPDHRLRQLVIGVGTGLFPQRQLRRRRHHLWRAEKTWHES